MLSTNSSIKQIKRSRTDKTIKKQKQAQSSEYCSSKRIKLIEYDSITTTTTQQTSKLIIGEQIKFAKSKKRSSDNTAAALFIDKLKLNNNNNKYKYSTFNPTSSSLLRIQNLKSKKQIFYTKNKMVNRVMSNSSHLTGSLDSLSEDSSFLKRQTGTTSLTLNSTEMDKKSTVKFSTFFESVECSSASSSSSSCSSCLDCSICNECKQQEWIDCPNFLSSTPMVIDSNDLTSSTEIKSKIKTKSTGFKLIQSYLKKNESSKKSKELNKIVRLKQSLKFKISKRDNQQSVIGAFSSQTACLPVSSSTTENFNNLGDFLVWYV